MSTASDSQTADSPADAADNSDLSPLRCAAGDLCKHHSGPDNMAGACAHKCLHCERFVHSALFCGCLIAQLEEKEGFTLPTHLLKFVGQAKLIDSSELLLCHQCIATYKSNSKPTNFTATDFETLTSWLAQYDPEDLPSELQSFTLTPIQSSIGRLIVLLANLVCQFDKTCEWQLAVKFTKQENDQFVKLQCYHHLQRFHTLIREGHDKEAAAAMMGSSIFQGTIKALQPLSLSPRMLIADEHERMNLKRTFANVLVKRAAEAEKELLRELELDENKTVKRKKKHRPKQQKKLQSKENLPHDRQYEEPERVKGDKETVSTKASTFAQVASAKVERKTDETTTSDEGTKERTKKVQFHKQLTNKAIKSNKLEAKGDVKGVLRKGLKVEVPKSNVVAHLMVPLKIDYENRVSDTALPELKKNTTTEQSSDEIHTSIAPPMSPSKSQHSNNSEFSALLSEIESLKAENAQLRREVTSAGQKLTEAVQRVQLKAYIAETARDSAQERAALLESLLVEVLEGKIAVIELQEVLLGLQEQPNSPTAGSSLNSLLERLPQDTWIHVSSNQNDESGPLRDELHKHKGILSRLRQGNSMNESAI